MFDLLVPPMFGLDKLAKLVKGKAKKDCSTAPTENEQN